MKDEVIVATILYNLRRKNKIGKKHTPLDTLRRGFPKHLGKNIGDIAKNLIKQNWIIKKPTSYGVEVSLNKNFIREIEEFIFKVMGFQFNHNNP